MYIYVYICIYMYIYACVCVCCVHVLNVSMKKSVSPSKDDIYNYSSEIPYK